MANTTIQAEDGTTFSRPHRQIPVDFAVPGHVEQFFAKIATEGRFSSEVSAPQPTKLSLALPTTVADILRVENAQICKDMQLLSAVLDAHCRSVDAVADGALVGEPASIQLQFSTLLLVRALSELTPKYDAAMLRIVYDGLRSASVSERAHYAAGAVEAKHVAGKNSALLVPAKLLCLASGQPERWPPLEALLLKVFSIVQEIDDVVDLDENVRANRRTSFSRMVYENLGCVDLNSLETSEFAHRRIVLLLTSLRATVPELDLPSETNSALLCSLTNAIESVKRVKIMPDFAYFKRSMMPLLPPIAAYGGI